jgi:hypothetical protein
MTHDDYTDLATLLRDDVTAGEPRHGPDAMVTVRLGRRRLRTRRLAGGVITAVVVGVGTAVVVPLATGPGSATSERGTDPAGAAHEEYDAQRMPELMDQHARAVLEHSVATPGPATFAAWGQDGQLAPAEYDEAVRMSVKLGDRDHNWYVSVTHGAGETEGSLEQDCREPLGSVDYLDCQVTATLDGRAAQVRLMALLPVRGAGGWRTATPAELASGRPVWYQRSVTVLGPDTVVQAGEMVRAGSGAAADAALVVPVPDLLEIGSDPVLWIPGPGQGQ